MDSIAFSLRRRWPEGPDVVVSRIRRRPVVAASLYCTPHQSCRFGRHDSFSSRRSLGWLRKTSATEESLLLEEKVAEGRMWWCSEFAGGWLYPQAVTALSRPLRGHPPQRGGLCLEKLRPSGPLPACGPAGLPGGYPPCSPGAGGGSPRRSPWRPWRP